MPCSCAGFACMERGRHTRPRCTGVGLQECCRSYLFHCRLDQPARRCRGGVTDRGDGAEASLGLLVEHADQLEPSKGQDRREQHEERTDHHVVAQNAPGRARTL